MVSTSVSRAVFISSIINILKTYNFFDGIDLDWEYPGVTWDGCPRGKEDRENFTYLFKRNPSSM